MCYCACINVAGLLHSEALKTTKRKLLKRLIFHTSFHCQETINHSYLTLTQLEIRILRLITVFGAIFHWGGKKRLSCI